MKEGAVGAWTEEQPALVEAQGEDLERLERMMRDLLDITRLEAGVVPPRFEMLPPAELIEAATQSVRQQAETQDVRLTNISPDDLPESAADRTQLVRVLVNLLNNAVRHTYAGGAVELSVSSDGAYAWFRVKDTGTGIPEEYQQRVFDKFVQVPGATRGGAGLGLSIARTIVHAHGGEITVESEPGNGSVFTFTIPVEEKEA